MLDVATINFDAADAESRCFRHLLLGVTNIVFQCCRCCVSMLQTFDVECCVEEKGERLPMLDVARNTGRNMTAI
jgi:hypothetical protein